jgi:hypothetical protein
MQTVFFFARFFGACAALIPMTIAAADQRPASPDPVLRHSEVMFMYAATPEVYQVYRGTFVAWGGANTPERVQMHRDAGVRCTGTIWFLTAGARQLHQNPELREAVVRDLEGNPIEVPWLFDHTHEGQKSWFGCTNHPRYREHLRDLVRKAMSGGPDGLHIDDHLGTAQSADHLGGGLCDHCMSGFRDYLRKNVSAAELEQAGVGDLDSFDYRTLIRKHAQTRQEYIKAQWKVPLMKHFIRFHREAAAELVGEMHRVAEEAAGKPVLLSANAWIGDERHQTVIPYLTHVVCEVPQNAKQGTANLQRAINTYRTAARFNIPLAGTASGHDWAFVAAGGQHDLVRIWIGLAYAHGQRFMVPHRQWCFTEQKGTHWHTFPVEEFAPIYHFIRDQAGWLDGFEQVEGIELKVPEGVLCTVRRNGARTVLHLLNLDYDATAGQVREKTNLTLAIPNSVMGGASTALILTSSAEPVELPLAKRKGELELTIPSLATWSLLALE